MIYKEGKLDKSTYTTMAKAIVKEAVTDVNDCVKAFGDDKCYTFNSVLSQIEHRIRTAVDLNQQSLQTYLQVETDRLTYARFIKCSTNKIICEINL